MLAQYCNSWPHFIPAAFPAALKKIRNYYCFLALYFTVIKHPTVGINQSCGVLMMNRKSYMKSGFTFDLTDKFKWLCTRNCVNMMSFLCAMLTAAESVLFLYLQLFLLCAWEYVFNTVYKPLLLFYIVHISLFHWMRKCTKQCYNAWKFCNTSEWLKIFFIFLELGYSIPVCQHIFHISVSIWLG
jgi:hypothetical protein